jgi:hypothetical protein
MNVIRGIDNLTNTTIGAVGGAISVIGGGLEEISRNVSRPEQEIVGVCVALRVQDDPEQQLLEHQLPVNKEALEGLRKKVDNYIKAHRSCKNENLGFDKLLKISILVLTSTTTYLLGTMPEEINKEDMKIDLYLSFSSAIVSGLNNYFDNSSNAQKHTNLILEYTQLKGKIDIYLNNPDVTQEKINEKQVKYSGKFTALKIKTENIGLFSFARRKFNIE